MEEAPSTNIGAALRWIARGITVLALSVFGFHASSALAATMYLSPSSGSYTPGGTFSVGVYVSSTNEAMNAVSGTIAFPPSILEATSVSQSGSIINLWSQQPSYSNSAGTVTFEGIVLNPGYTGSGGKVATITFSAKSAGAASVAFSRGSILANDGLGSDITSGLGSATFTIAEAEAAPSTPTAPSTAVPYGPTISSTTHPDETAWYANANPSFAWTLPNGVTGVNVLADHGATTNPGTTSDGLRSSYSYTDVDDGNWYFHVRLENANGWGAVSHFAFNIDTAAPTVTAVVQEGEPQKIVVTGTDALSGIARYGFAIDGGAEISWIDDGTHTYTLPALEVGEHAVVVTAYDQAVNTATATVNVLGTGVEAEVPPVEEIAVEPAGVHPVMVWFLFIVLITILLAALFAVFVVGWKLIYHASQYKVVLVKRELPRKDPYRHVRKKFTKLFTAVQKKADRRRAKGLTTKSGRRTADQDLEALLKDVISQVQSIRNK